MGKKEKAEPMRFFRLMRSSRSFWATLASTRIRSAWARSAADAPGNSGANTKNPSPLKNSRRRRRSASEENKTPMTGGLPLTKPPGAYMAGPKPNDSAQGLFLQPFSCELRLERASLLLKDVFSPRPKMTLSNPGPSLVRQRFPMVRIASPISPRLAPSISHGKEKTLFLKTYAPPKSQL